MRDMQKMSQCSQLFAKLNWIQACVTYGTCQLFLLAIFILLFHDGKIAFKNFGLRAGHAIVLDNWD